MLNTSYIWLSLFVSLLYDFDRVLSTDNSILCPKLSDDPTKHLQSFTTITRFVNDSYLMSDHNKRYSMVPISQNPIYNYHFDNILTVNNSLLSDTGLNNFAITFIIDFDEYCVNTVEVFYNLQYNKYSNLDEILYTSYSLNGWQKINNIVTGDIPIDFLNIIDTKTFFKIPKTLIKTIVYFQSFGILLISDSGKDVLAYCSNNGWKVKDHSIRWSTSKIDFTKIDATFVDSDNQIVYFFETKTIGNNNEHIRDFIHECHYLLESENQIDLNCKRKDIKIFCPYLPFWKIYYIPIAILFTIFAIIVVIILILLFIYWFRFNKKVDNYDIQTITIARPSRPVITKDSSSAKSSVFKQSSEKKSIDNK